MERRVFLGALAGAALAPALPLLKEAPLKFSGMDVSFREPFIVTICNPGRDTFLLERWLRAVQIGQMETIAFAPEPTWIGPSRQGRSGSEKEPQGSVSEASA